MKLIRWLSTLNRLLGWVIFFVGAVFWILSNSLTVAQISELGLDASVWQLIGTGLILLAIVLILLQYQNQLDSLKKPEQKQRLPKRPHFNKYERRTIKEYLSTQIHAGDEIKSSIEPNRTDNLNEVRSAISKFISDLEKWSWEIAPEYTEFITSSSTWEDKVKYFGWNRQSAAEYEKVDNLLARLRAIYLQL